MSNVLGKVTAVVPTRKGSERVIAKNTREFFDTNLLELKFRVLQQVKGIDEIILNTDCEISIEIAKKYGIKVHVRDPLFASSHITNNLHWKHLAETTDSDIILLAQTTSPLIKVSTYEKAITEFTHSNSIDSINSVSLEKKFLWKDNEPINYDRKLTPKSQDLPEIVSLNFGITLIAKENMFKYESVIGQNPKFVILDKIESIDIDDMIDFEFAEFMYSKLGHDWLLSK